MDDEAATEKLAAALEDAGVGVWLERTLLADALLPVVREIAAEELRAAADDPRIGYGARHIRAHADALTGEAS